MKTILIGISTLIELKSIHRFMVLIFLLFQVGLIMPGGGLTQPNGISAMQIMSGHWHTAQCENLIASLKTLQDPAIAILQTSFGKSTFCLRKIGESFRNQDITLQIHFSNEVCRRNRNCTNLDHLYKDSVVKYNRALERSGLIPSVQVNRLLLRARALTKIFGDEPEHRFILSMGLESNYTKKAALNLYGQMRKNWSYEISYNPSKKSYSNRINGTLHELHGYKSVSVGAHNCIANGDGSSIDGFDKYWRGQSATVQEARGWARENDCIHLLWIGRWQGFLGERRFIEPHRRRFEFNSEDILLAKGIYE